MASRRSTRIQEDVAPNLIPMIDIMFLLLLFFMLGADMGQRDIEDVSLPIANAIKEDKEATTKSKDRLTINVYHRYHTEVQCSSHASGQLCPDEKHWRISIRGDDHTAPEKLTARMKKEADLYRDDGSGQKSSERRVMVRADGAAPYGFVQDIMTACAHVGIYQIECGAARPTPEKDKDKAKEE
jgi:biopolymer transport protein ExbD